MNTIVENKLLMAIARLTSPLLLAMAVPAFFWITSSVNELQKTVAVLSDRLAQNSPAYKPSDALRDQALVDARLLAMTDRISRNERRLDDLEKVARQPTPATRP